MATLNTVAIARPPAWLLSLTDNTRVSVLESLASVVSVVSTDVRGINYLLRHQKTALLLPPGDPVAVAGQVMARQRSDAPKSD